MSNYKNPTEETMQEALYDLLDAVLHCINTGEEIYPPAELESIASVHSFDEVGVLSRDNGLVIRMQDGSEFQLTIVQSR